MKASMKITLSALTAILLLGCAMGGGKPAVMIEQYAIEYAPRAPRGSVPAEAAIRVDRFSVAQIFNSARIVYRERPYRFNEYAYHRWRANPGDMVGDCLLRDLRHSGLFRAVFSYRDIEDIPLVLKGGVAEFFEADEGGGRRAVLSIHLTLLDQSAREAGGRVVFQKNYRCEEPVEEKTVPGFVRAMSRAAEKLSAQAVGDVYQAVQGGNEAKGRQESVK